MVNKIGFGGSCHWCTEAIFMSLKGVIAVEQGWISGDGDASTLSEAVIVVFDPELISLKTLIAVHLHTHSCTAVHSMRAKYRSAVYTFSNEQVTAAQQIITDLQPDFNAPIVTMVLPFKAFKGNTENYLNYYYNNPQKPFCQNVINPKLQLLMARFKKEVDTDKLKLPSL